jgi:hypothetical protein
MPTPLAHDRFARAGARQSHVMCACVACGTPATPPPHLHQDRAHPCHICTGTRLTPPTSAAPELESSLPRLHRDWAHPCHSACVHVRVRACVRLGGEGGGALQGGMPERRPRELAVPANHRGAQEPSPAATLHTAGRKASPLRQPLNEQASWPVTAQKRAAHADARRTSSGQRRKQGGEHDMTSPTRCVSQLPWYPRRYGACGLAACFRGSSGSRPGADVAAVSLVLMQMWQR